MSTTNDPRRAADAVAVAVRTAAAFMGADDSRAALLGRCAASIVGGGEVTMADLAAMYGRSRRWAFMQLRAHGIAHTSRAGKCGSSVDLARFVEAVGLPSPRPGMVGTPRGSKTTILKSENREGGAPL